MAAAIEVIDVAKKFRLYHEKTHSLKQTMLMQRKNIYEDYWVLRDINFTVEPGSTMALIGGNGSGKSTLLKMVARILRPNSGSIKVNGRVSALLELGAGFQQDYTGRENVFLNGSILGLSEREIKKRFDEIVSFAELEKFIDTPVRNYSSGMYMRLAFSIAVSVDPDILLIDEVLAVGDEAFQRKCFEKITSFKEQGKTILFVSHDPSAVERLCEKAVLLDNGHMVAIDRAAKVIEHYRGILSSRDALPGTDGQVQEGQADNPYYMRHGSKHAEITRVSLLNSEGNEVGAMETGEDTVIELRVKVHEKIVNPIFGFIIRKEEAGVLHDVYKTNTMWQRSVTGTFPKGSEFSVRFAQKMNLGGGSYYISPAIAYEDAARFYDWHDNVTYFQMMDEGDWQGVVNLQSRILIGEQ
jgi:ABC-type polysaccharide/polyol phosphate transport system ATPase subunit